MALHRLDIADGSLLLNDVLVGALSTSPPEGVSANTTTSTEDGVVRLKIRWTAEKSPDQLLPLEILGLRLGEFYPHAAFVGGRKYDMSRAEPLRGKRLGFPYNTYYKYRMKAPARYDCALFSKMPLACWQERTRAFALVFPKILTLPKGPAPVFIRASGAEAAINFSAAILNEFEIERRQSGWFGAGTLRKRHNLVFSSGQSIEATFLLIAADTWAECIQACEKHLYRPRPSGGTCSAESLSEMLSASVRFYDRVWDARNKTHVHLPVKNVPGFESVAFKHSHITDDLTKLVLYRRLAEAGYDNVERREQELLAKIVEGSYRFGNGDAPLWHTTTYYNGRGLEAFTHHGTGFVGFPGGMGTVVRRLFEYCSLHRDEALGKMARAGADWLAGIQREDGSWPALFTGKGDSARAGCVASTAEVARALVAGYPQTEEQRHDSAAAAIRFINREESFFECRQYLRDVDYDEADGITAEACIHANLDWHAFAHDGSALDNAEKWATYALQWIRPRSPEYLAEPSFDGLARSITPRVDVWGSLLIARAFLRLARASGHEKWRNLGWQLFENIARLQERDGGLCETWFLDFPSGFESIHIEPTFVTDAFVEFILDACRHGENDLPADLFSGHRASMRKKHLPLQPAIGQGLQIGISRGEPEWILDRGLRLLPAFDGVYDRRGVAGQAFYTMLREVRPGRWLLKLAPIIKIMLDRHQVDPPPSGIGKSTHIEVLGFASEDSGDGHRSHRYRTAFHDITLSVVSGLAGEGELPAADLCLDIKTIAGDIRVNQVRIDLQGQYGIESVDEGDGFVVSTNENNYSVRIVEGEIGGIIRCGNKLAIDISLNSNWNFFGEYSLRMRVTRIAES